MGLLPEAFSEPGHRLKQASGMARLDFTIGVQRNGQRERPREKFNKSMRLEYKDFLTQNVNYGTKCEQYDIYIFII